MHSSNYRLFAAPGTDVIDSAQYTTLLCSNSDFAFNWSTQSAKRNSSFDEDDNRLFL